MAAGLSCPECDSPELTWAVVKQVSTPIADGSLRLHDVEVTFALGCDHCSETVRTVDADAVTKVLTRMTREAL